ncbi:hypothetical protein V3G39_04075 [Dermatophilaceae bacterium Sec6.4]
MRTQGVGDVRVTGRVLDSAGHPVAHCPIGAIALTPDIGLWDRGIATTSDGHWGDDVPPNAAYEFRAGYRGSNGKHQAVTRVDVGTEDLEGVDIILPGIEQAWGLLNELVTEGLQEANVLQHPPQTSEELQAVAETITTRLIVGGAKPRGLRESSS